MYCTTCGTALGSRSTCPACGAAAPTPDGGGIRSTLGGGTPTGSTNQPPPQAPGAPWNAEPNPTAVMPVPPSIAPTGGTGGFGTPASGAPRVAPPEEPKRSRRLALIIGSIVVIVALAAAAFLVLRPEGDNTDTVASGSKPSPTTQTTSGDDGLSSTTTEPVRTTTTTQPASVPSLVDMTLDEAKARVKGMGVDLKVVNVANEEKPSGTILKQTPEAEAPFEATITVNVARPPLKTYLADLEAVEHTGDGIEGSGNATLNTTTYTRSLWMLSCGNYPHDRQNSAGWDLARRYSRFAAIVGVPDNAPSGSFAKFQVYGDGRLLADVDGRLGTPATINVDTTGVLRLTLRVSGIGCESYTFGQALGVFADPVLTSPPAAE